MSEEKPLRWPAIHNVLGVNAGDSKAYITKDFPKGISVTELRGETEGVQKLTILSWFKDNFHLVSAARPDQTVGPTAAIFGEFRGVVPDNVLSALGAVLDFSDDQPVPARQYWEQLPYPVDILQTETGTALTDEKGNPIELG